MGVVCFDLDRYVGKKLKEMGSEAYELDQKLSHLRRVRRNLEDGYRLRWEDDVKAKFLLRREHVVLLKRMQFRLVEGTDVASVAASGKYPFGNSDWVKDIFEELGWQAEYDEDGLKAACVHRAQRIMAELPLALDHLLSQINPDDYPEHPALGDTPTP